MILVSTDTKYAFGHSYCPSPQAKNSKSTLFLMYVRKKFGLRRRAVGVVKPLPIIKI